MQSKLVQRYLIDRFFKRRYGKVPYNYAPSKVSNRMKPYKKVPYTIERYLIKGSFRWVDTL